jgi:hypothetical protein
MIKLDITADMDHGWIETTNGKHTKRFIKGPNLGESLWER